jgi:hypothetical protein
VSASSPVYSTKRRALTVHRFGDENDMHRPTPLYKVLYAPSRVLRAHNLEILVSTLNVNTANMLTTASTESSAESVLVPKLQATSARGTPVPYPVHKTLVVAEGLDSALAFGRFSSDSAEDMRNMVKVAVDLPAPQKETAADAQAESAVIDVEVGSQALASFRESVANSQIFERGWFRSGLPTLTQWLTADLQPAEPIKPAMRTLIASIADDVEAKILKEDTARLAILASIPTDHETTAAITNALNDWAENRAPRRTGRGLLRAQLAQAIMVEALLARRRRYHALARNHRAPLAHQRREK